MSGEARIAASRTDVPTLAAEVERLRADNAHMFRRLSDQERYNIQSRRSLYEQSERYKAERDAALARIRAVEELFAGGPDTPCRTIWQAGIECVSVPIADLHAALAAPTEDSDQ